MLLGVSCEITAFCWDRAVNRFGSHIEAELDKAQEGKDTTKKAEAAREGVFKKWFGQQQQAGPKKFRDPAKRG